MRLAIASSRLPSLEDHPSLLQDVEAGRHLGEDARCSAQAGANEARSRAERCRGGQPVGQDDRGGRRGARPRLAKKVKGRKRHLLVDTQGLVLKAKVHSAKVMDYEGIKTLLEGADQAFPRLRHLWLDAGYRGEDKGADWVQKTLGWSADLVKRPKKPAPEEVLMAWAWKREGVSVDWQKLLPPRGFVVLPRRWVV
jgi:putative transposase